MVRFFPKLWKIHSDWLEIPELGRKTVLVDKFFGIIWNIVSSLL